MANVDKLLSLQGGRTKALATGDAVSAVGAWTFAENAIFNAPVVFNGGAHGVVSENVLIADPFTVNAYNYQTDADRAAGQVFITRGSAAFSISSISANKLLTSADPTGTIAAGDLISVVGAANPLNLGLFEVASVDAAGITIQTSPDGSVAGIVGQALTNDATAAGSVAKARVSILRADAAGAALSMAFGSSVPLTFAEVVDAADITLQNAYNGGNTISTDPNDTIDFALNGSTASFSVSAPIANEGEVSFGSVSNPLAAVSMHAAAMDINAPAIDILGDVTTLQNSAGTPWLSFDNATGVTLDAAAVDVNLGPSGNMTVMTDAFGAFVVDNGAEYSGYFVAGSSNFLAGAGLYAQETQISGQTLDLQSDTLKFIDGEWPSTTIMAKFESLYGEKRFVSSVSLIADKMARNADAIPGYTPAVGDVVACVAGAQGRLTLADADDVNELYHRPMGVVLASAGTDGGDLLLASISGMIATPTFDVAPLAADHGKVVYLSTVAGKVTLTPPTASGSAVVEIGQLAYGADGSNLNPSVQMNIRYVALN